MAHHLEDGRRQGLSKVALCRADEVQEGAARGFRLGSGADQIAVMVLRSGGVLRAFVNSCPHAGTPLDFIADRFFDRDGRLLLCGTHGARFRPDDGVCVSGPCLGKRLAALSLTVIDDRIAVELPP